MTRSYWQIKGDHLVRPPKPEGAVSRVCDIAVVGGGLLGISTAHYLKSLGCNRVIVLEKEHVGYGASGRNAGFLLSGMAEPYSRLLVGMGRDWAMALMKATIENHDLIANVISEKKISCNYQRIGSYHLAVTDAERRELADSVEKLQKDGFTGEFFGAGAIAANLGFGNYTGGYFCPVDGNLDPYAFVNGLADGLDIIEGFDVRSIRKIGGQVELLGDIGSVKSEMIVLATNAYSPLLDDYFNNMIFPVRGQMLATTAGQNKHLAKTTYYANFGYDYFRQSPDGAILMGGLRDKFIESEVGFSDDLNPALQKGLEDYVHANLGLDSFEVEYRWSGLMANTIDGLPLVGALPHNSSVVAAVGCNGHGFGLGMIIARDVARALVLGETSDLLKRFSLKRFAR